jgi:hypothetical protein
VVIVVLCFASSFEFSFFAAFMHRVDPESVAQFKLRDKVYTLLFCCDLVLNLLQLPEKQRDKDKEAELQRSDDGF